MIITNHFLLFTCTITRGAATVCGEQYQQQRSRTTAIKMGWTEEDVAKLKDALTMEKWKEGGETWNNYISKSIFKNRKDPKEIANKFTYMKRTRDDWRGFHPTGRGVGGSSKKQKVNLMSADAGDSQGASSGGGNVLSMTDEEFKFAKLDKRLSPLAGHGVPAHVFSLQHGVWIIWNRMAGTSYEIKAYPKHGVIEMSTSHKPPQAKSDLAGLHRPNCPGDTNELWNYVKKRRPGLQEHNYTVPMPEGLTTVGRKVAKSKKYVGLYLPRIGKEESKDTLNDSDDESLVNVGIPAAPASS